MAISTQTLLKISSMSSKKTKLPNAFERKRKEFRMSSEKEAYLSPNSVTRMVLKNEKKRIGSKTTQLISYCKIRLKNRKSSPKHQKRSLEQRRTAETKHRSRLEKSDNQYQRASRLTQRSKRYQSDARSHSTSTIG